MAHRLALCTSQAANQVEKMEKYKQLLTDLYYHFSKSAKRVAGLKAIQEIVESPKLKIKEMHSVSWVAFYSSVETVYRSWDALVTNFANHKKDAKAVGFLKKLTPIENDRECGNNVLPNGYYSLGNTAKQHISERGSRCFNHLGVHFHHPY